MKTKTLIKLLQEADPSGELECNAGLEDIFYVDRMPYYYDGVAELLVRDNTRTDYNIIGAKFNETEDKVCIRTWSIEDALYENPELPVQYSSYTLRYKERIEKIREEARQVIKDTDQWYTNYKGTEDSTDKFFKTKEHKL